jgi:hypothetical protein
MGHDHWVVVHVHDPRLGRDRLCDLVRVVGGRQAGTDVEKLADARLTGQERGRSPQEAAVFLCGGRSAGPCRCDPVAGGAIRGEMVLPAEPVVVAACRMRDRRVAVRRVGSCSMPTHGHLHRPLTVGDCRSGPDRSPRCCRRCNGCPRVARPTVFKGSTKSSVPARPRLRRSSVGNGVRQSISWLRYARGRGSVPA